MKVQIHQNDSYFMILDQFVVAEQPQINKPIRKKIVRKLNIPKLRTASTALAENSKRIKKRNKLKSLLQERISEWASQNNVDLRFMTLSDKKNLLLYLIRLGYRSLPFRLFIAGILIYNLNKIIIQLITHGKKKIKQKLILLNQKLVLYRLLEAYSGAFSETLAIAIEMDIFKFGQDEIDSHDERIELKDATAVVPTLMLVLLNGGTWSQYRKKIFKLFLLMNSRDTAMLTESLRIYPRSDYKVPE